MNEAGELVKDPESFQQAVMIPTFCQGLAPDDTGSTQWSGLKPP